jgi:hypothetical protein
MASLEPDMAKQVFRLIWMRAADHLVDLDAESIPGWLFATTQREVMRAKRLAG